MQIFRDVRPEEGRNKCFCVCAVLCCAVCVCVCCAFVCAMLCGEAFCVCVLSFCARTVWKRCFVKVNYSHQGFFLPIELFNHYYDLNYDFALKGKKILTPTPNMRALRQRACNVSGKSCYHFCEGYPSSLKESRFCSVT